MTAPHSPPAAAPAAPDAANGAEALIRMLQLHGVRHVFGVCGDTSLPYYDALYRLDHGITHVLARDERSASYLSLIHIPSPRD